ncbi:MAG: hypothetical protein AAF403_08730, partial [Pseudomonadota bacterium]
NHTHQDLDHFDAENRLIEPMRAMRRIFLLRELIQKIPHYRQLTAAHLFDLAEALGHFFDTANIEGVDLQKLDEIKGENDFEGIDMASHWRQLSNFLSIMRDHWPFILQHENKLDPILKHHQAIDRLCQNWLLSEPKNPVIIAGSTGSHLSTRNLMAIVAKLKNGYVFLPGFDRLMSDDLFAGIAQDPSHPQYMMGLSVRKLKLKASDIHDCLSFIDKTNTTHMRTQLMQFMMLPSKFTPIWANQAGNYNAHFKNINLIEAPSLDVEARVIALKMRENVEKQSKTALVTSNRALSKRVILELKRWSLYIDDSAGVNFSNTCEGQLFLQIAELLSEDLSVRKLLNILSHPLVCIGDTQKNMMAMAHWIEVFCRKNLKASKGLPLLDELSTACH